MSNEDIQYISVYIEIRMLMPFVILYCFCFVFLTCDYAYQYVIWDACAYSQLRHFFFPIKIWPQAVKKSRHSIQFSSFKPYWICAWCQLVTVYFTCGKLIFYASLDVYMSMLRQNFCNIFFSIQMRPLHTTPWHNKVTGRGGGICRLHLFVCQEQASTDSIDSSQTSSL